jgi:hypothetical protein
MFSSLAKNCHLVTNKKVHGTDTKDFCEKNSPKLPNFEEIFYGISIFKQ